MVQGGFHFKEFFPHGICLTMSLRFLVSLSSATNSAGGYSQWLINHVTDCVLMSLPLLGKLFHKNRSSYIVDIISSKYTVLVALIQQDAYAPASAY